MTLGGVLRTIGKIALILVVFAFVGLILIYVQLQNSFRAPRAIPAGTVWTTTTVSLSRDHTVAQGRLTLGGGTVPTGRVRVGLNAGVPSVPSASAAPGAILAGPLVRLSYTIAGVASTCFAPCELVLPTAFECTSSSCTLEVRFTIELGGGDSTRGAVSVSIAGGATAGGTAGPAVEFGPGFGVELYIDGALSPRST